jgi:tetratricopeptide (TPR) repeat protein
MLSKFYFAFICFGILIFKAIGQPAYPLVPKDASIVSSDIVNFIAAYKLLNPESDSLTILRENYFDKGSPGLKEYCNRHGLTPENLSAAIKSDPEAYGEISNFFDALPEFKEQVLEEFEKFGEIIPDAMYPPTYLLIGANRGIGQASPEGQLITIVKGLKKPDKLINVIVHELAHFQQARSLGFQAYIGTYSKPDNMLDLVLREGGAQFINYYLVRENVEDYGQLKYVEDNEKELRDRFEQDLSKQDSNYWLWESLDKDDHPILLGYAVGYKIIKAYYDNAENKADAIKDILAITDAKEFLARSGYPIKY